METTSIITHMVFELLLLVLLWGHEVFYVPTFLTGDSIAFLLIRLVVAVRINFSLLLSRACKAGQFILNGGHVLKIEQAPLLFRLDMFLCFFLNCRLQRFRAWKLGNELCLTRRLELQMLLLNLPESVHAYYIGSFDRPSLQAVVHEDLRRWVPLILPQHRILIIRPRRPMHFYRLALHWNLFQYLKLGHAHTGDDTRGPIWLTCIQ